MAPARAAIAQATIAMPIRLDPALLRQRFVLIGQADRGEYRQAAGAFEPPSDVGGARANGFRTALSSWRSPRAILS